MQLVSCLIHFIRFSFSKRDGWLEHGDEFLVSGTTTAAVH